MILRIWRIEMIQALNSVLGEELDHFEIEQALGRYPDVHRVAKYGRNLSITSTSAYQDIWVRTHNRTDLTVASTLYAVSSSALDTMQIKISGVDGEYNYQETTITLNGTTPVTLNGTWLRVFESLVLGATPKVGELYISTSNATTPEDATIQAYCPAECQRALMSHFTIPKNYYGLVKSYTVSASKGKDLKVKAVIKPFGGQYIAAEEIGIYESTTQLQTYFFKIGPKSDLKFQAITSNPTAKCYVAYTCYLFPIEYNVDNVIKSVIV